MSCTPAGRVEYGGGTTLAEVFVALLFALSSVINITQNLSRCFFKLYIRTTNMSVSGVTTVIERIFLINGLPTVYFFLSSASSWEAR